MLACTHSLVEHGAGGDDALETMVARVESVRGIQARRPIDARVVTQPQLVELLRSELVAQRRPEEIEGYEAGLVTVGLWPPDLPLVATVVDLMAEEVAGLYLADERALLVVSERELPFSQWLEWARERQDFMAEFALSHELVHLLQHQRYPTLLENDALYFSNDDLAVSVQSAFEGDAMYFGSLALGVPLPEPSDLKVSVEQEMQQADGALASAPRLLRELLVFPYSQGYRLAFREADQLLEDPPASSEQAIHEERRWDAFTVFDLAALSRLLPEGCLPVFENTVGELQLRILLQELGPEEATPAVWEGWDGDRYLAARCGDRRALLWLTSWDSEADAEEFAAGYSRLATRAAARAGLTQPVRVERFGRQVVVASAELHGLMEAVPAQAERARVRSVRELRAFAGRGQPGDS